MLVDGMAACFAQCRILLHLIIERLYTGEVTGGAFAIFFVLNRDVVSNILQYSSI